MGRSGPLDHPELLEVQQLLDNRDVAEAQRKLSRVGDHGELAVGVSYLTTRLLHARGRLDLRGVAERLRELLATYPDFPEAQALLAQAEAHASARAPSPSPAAGPRKVTPVMTPSERKSLEHPIIRTPRVAPADSSDGHPAVRPGTRTAPMPREGSDGKPSSRRGARTSPMSPSPKTSSKPPSKKRKSQRVLTPIPELQANESPRAPGGREIRNDSGAIPQIPRMPALPQFRDNSSPPSYAPDRRNSEPNLFRNKSLLPENAGRYSEQPTSMDVIEPGRRQRSKAPRAPAVPAGQSQRRATSPQTPERIRSASPPKNSAVAPTLFEIASWIDEGRFRDAVAAINRAGPSAGPEYAVLRARALAGAGYTDQALELLEQIDRKPSPDAELRAASARLFVELGHPSRALTIAEQALEAEPGRPLVRLTFALAAVRTCRRHPDVTLLHRAERALEKFAAREGPLPALYLSLRACVLAGTGDPQRGIAMAQRALGLDPRSPDALAAVAEASARLGRVHDAQQAWSQLAEVAPAEGEAVAALLAGLNPDVASTASSTRAIEPAPLWTSVDTQLVAGMRVEVLHSLERSAREAIRRMAKAVLKEDFTAIATVGASFLTTSPVLSSFAPYDTSLWSIRRLEAALDLICGLGTDVVLPETDTALVVLLGSYFGESIRFAYDGRWEGRSADLDSAMVVTSDQEVYPFRILSARVHHGRRAAFASAPRAALSKQSSSPWKSRIGNPVAPPTPWAPSPWPPPSQIGYIGRSLSQSPIGRYCEEFAQGPLDRTTSSLIALDAYLDVVAPRGAPVDADAAWTRRVSVLAGGYLGETLRELVGGEWVYGVDAADDALGFRLRLRGTTEALPVAQVLERVIGERSSSLVDYARTMMRRVGRA